jgi:hypothetical protein
MDAKLIQALREERDQLHRQIDLIDKLLASHPQADSHRPAPKPDPVVVGEPKKRANGHVRPESKESVRRRAIVDLLKERGEVHRKVIFDHLGSLGIAPPSIGQLAPLLANHKELFVTDMRGNYRLAEAVKNHPTDPGKDRSGSLFGA